MLMSKDVFERGLERVQKGHLCEGATTFRHLVLSTWKPPSNGEERCENTRRDKLQNGGERKKENRTSSGSMGTSLKNGCSS